MKKDAIVGLPGSIGAWKEEVRLSPTGADGGLGGWPGSNSWQSLLFLSSDCNPQPSHMVCVYYYEILALSQDGRY